MRALLLVVATVLVAGCAQEAAPIQATVSTPTVTLTPTPATIGPTPTPAPVTPSAVPEPGGAQPILVPPPNEVYLWKNAFVNETTEIVAASNVTWTNLDAVAHTVTADDGSFDSGEIRPEYPYARSFSTPGSYGYHCRIHPAMRGTIEVMGDRVVVLEPIGGGAAHPAVELIANATNASTTPGGTASFQVTVQNTGDVARRFQLSYFLFRSGPDRNWSIQVEPAATARLEPQATQVVAVRVEVPMDALAGERLGVALNANGVPETGGELAANDAITLNVVVAPPAPPPPTQVNIQGFAFAPASITIPAGTTVRWTNLEGPHTATADNGAFNTGTLGNGASAEHTFAAAGTFGYFCAIHPSMRGTVIVS